MVRGTVEEIGRADPEVVRRLLDHLVAAFEGFADQEAGRLSYVDALMGCHNFYKVVILDLEKRSGSNLIRHVALQTLEATLIRGERR